VPPDRNFIEAVLWWCSTGAAWRDLPVEFGSWKTVFKRFDRWAKRDKSKDLFDALQTDRDDEWHGVDSAINRAHQQAAGATGGKRRKLWGASRSPSYNGSSLRTGSRSRHDE
jgi:transposase